MSRIYYELDSVTINSSFRLTNVFCSACKFDYEKDIMIPSSMCSLECYEEAENYNKHESYKYEIIIRVKDDNGKLLCFRCYSQKMEKLTEEEIQDNE